jgi:solute:Na+ symporter, SSS family
VIALIVGYAIAVAAASWWVARGLRGPRDFLMGHRGLGVAHGIGLFGGIFLAATAVGIVGQGYRHGVAGAALDVALGVGFGILGLTLLDRMRASPHASLAALLRAQYGPVAGAIGTVLVAGAWMIMLAGFVAAASVALGQLTGWAQGPCIAITVVILLLYAMPGGMRAVTATNFVHLAALAVLIGALWVLAVGHSSVSPAPVSHDSFSWGYVIGLLLVSAPTTVVAPDVMMGMSAVRTRRTARTTLVLVVLLLACGGVVLALLGVRADHLVSSGDADHVLPDLIDLLLPHGASQVALLALFGAALTGAVAEVMVCTFILNDQITSRRAARGAEPLGLSGIRLQMVAVAALAGAVALADPNVVGLVITAFRVFVPGIVSQAVLALLGRPVRPGAVAASMVAGPLVCLTLAEAWPGLRDTAADPVLWGTLVSVAILTAGLLPRHRARLHEP